MWPRKKKKISADFKERKKNNKGNAPPNLKSHLHIRIKFCIYWSCQPPFSVKASCQFAKFYCCHRVFMLPSFVLPMPKYTNWLPLELFQTVTVRSLAHSANYIIHSHRRKNYEIFLTRVTNRQTNTHTQMCTRSYKISYTVYLSVSVDISRIK